MTAPAPPLVAYFSMEFGLHEEFPSYDGGLGVLAGDFMKSPGDLGVPSVGIARRSLHLPVDLDPFNEGHAVFAGVGLIADRMEAEVDFRTAWREVREKIVFTTHTPVPAGNEVHAIEDLRRLGAGCELVAAELREIGGDPFNMTVAGPRRACPANALAQLHRETAPAPSAPRPH